MNINLTLIAQLIAFAFFVWFTKKFVWSFVMQALEERKQKIADGLAAAERGVREQELAEQRAKERLEEARGKAAEILAQAQKRADEMIDEAKTDARSEGQRLLHAARAEIDQEMTQTREQLRGEVVKLALLGAEQVLEREVDAGVHNDSLQKVAAQL
jgi:F-type H+-transporting ATPase subunit b